MPPSLTSSTSKPAGSATLQAAPLVRSLPPLPRAGEVAHDLSPLQRRLMVGGIVVAHVAAVWGLMQISAVREAVIQAAPMFVSLIAPPAQPTPPAPPPPPPPPPPKSRPVQVKPPPPAPVIAAAPSPAPAAFVVPAPPPEPAAELAPPVPAVVTAAPTPAPAPPAPPKIIPASAIQFLESPVVDYPRLSKRNGESGEVIVRVYVDTAGGAPRSVQVNKSSGHSRLDDAAVAAVLKARFKPFTENGRPIEGWALIPIHFGLEK